MSYASLVSRLVLSVLDNWCSILNFTSATLIYTTTVLVAVSWFTYLTKSRRICSHVSTIFHTAETERQDCPVCVRSVYRIGDRTFRNYFAQSRNAVKTTEISLDLSLIRFTAPTRQDETVLSCPCRYSELVIRRTV